jgi:deazaflavin-dependent oxidoreductase (nitroreductase family)
MLEVIGGPGTLPGEVIVVAGLGRTADWYRNVRARPAAEVAIGRRRFRPTHRVLDEDEAAEALADYERRNRWAAPVVHRMLSWLVGWKYDGSSVARRRSVHELPLVVRSDSSMNERERSWGRHGISPTSSNLERSGGINEGATHHATPANGSDPVRMPSAEQLATPEHGGDRGCGHARFCRFPIRA